MITKNINQIAAQYGTQLHFGYDKVLKDVAKGRRNLW